MTGSMTKTRSMTGTARLVLVMGALLVLAGCGGGDDTAANADCSALPDGWPRYALVEEPRVMNETVTTRASGSAFTLTIDDLRFRKSENGDAVGPVYRIDMRLPAHCALGQLEGTVSGHVETGEGQARLSLRLDGAGLTHDWGRDRNEAFALDLAREYQPGFIDPRLAPAGVAQDNETAYRIEVMLQPSLYGTTGEAKLIIEQAQIEPTIVAAPGRDG